MAKTTIMVDAMMFDKIRKDTRMKLLMKWDAEHAVDILGNEVHKIFILRTN